MNGGNTEVAVSFIEHHPFWALGEAAVSEKIVGIYIV